MSQDDRTPTAREERMREGLLAYALHGSSRKAAAATGISYRTIASWVASDRGQRMMNDLRREVGAKLGAQSLRIAQKFLDKMEAEYDGLNAGQLVVPFGILVDKAKVLGAFGAPAGGEGDGRDLTVKLVFTGARAPAPAEPPTVDAPGVVVEGRAPAAPPNPLDPPAPRYPVRTQEP